MKDETEKKDSSALRIIKRLLLYRLIMKNKTIIILIIAIVSLYADDTLSNNWKMKNNEIIAPCEYLLELLKK